MHYLGKNIQYLRKKANKNQSEIALLVKKGQTTVANWETGKSEPSLDEIIIISNNFGVTVDALLKEDIERIENPGPNAGASLSVRDIYTDINILNLASEVQALRKEVDQLKKRKYS